MIKNVTIDRDIVVRTRYHMGDGVLLSSNNNEIFVPANCKFIAIQALYEKYVDGGKGGGYYEYGCAVKRVKVTENTKYTGLNLYSGDDRGYDYMAGFNTYYNHPLLGEIPSSTDATYFKIYSDDGNGIVYTDINIRNRYKDLTGGSIPL